MRILSGDFNAKVDAEDAFKPTIGNGSLREIINGVRVPSKLYHIQKSNCREYNIPTLQHSNIHLNIF
jgi:hypothetical protein